MPFPGVEAFDIQMVQGAGHLTLTEISIFFNSLQVVSWFSKGFPCKHKRIKFKK